MKKHMLKETNDMRRLMNLPLIKEEVEGVDAPESAGALEKDEEDHGDVVNEDDVIGTGDTGASDEDGSPESEKGLKKFDQDAIFEDSEGEETYNYGEDEGADEHREDEMEDELHHDEEDMDPHSRIKAIEDHLDALKKDMGYDEDHEDRDEEGTHFAEGKKYSRVLNTLTESEYKRLRKYISKSKKYSRILNTLNESEIKKLKRFIR